MAWRTSRMYTDELDEIRSRGWKVRYIMLENRCNRHELSPSEVQARIEELERLDEINKKEQEEKLFQTQLVAPRSEATRRKNTLKT